MSGTYGGPDPIGLFMSTDQGSTWTQQAATGVSGTSYGGYALDMAVDPASPGDGSQRHDLLRLPRAVQVDRLRRRRSIRSASGTPTPTHGRSCRSRAARTRSSTAVPTAASMSLPMAGAASTRTNKGGLQTGLFYNIAIKPDATASVTAGALQDNQIQTTAGGVTSPEWLASFGGDGWDVAWDGATRPSSTRRAVGRPLWSPPRTTTARPSRPRSRRPGRSADTGGLLADAAGGRSERLRDTLRKRQPEPMAAPIGGSWRIIFTPGTSGNVDVAPSQRQQRRHRRGKPGSTSRRTRWPLQSGSPAGVSFTDITANLPSRNVTRVVFDPLDPNMLYAVLTGFSGGPRQNVFRTTTARRHVDKYLARGRRPVRRDRGRRDNDAEHSVRRHRLRGHPLDRPRRLMVGAR